MPLVKIGEPRRQTVDYNVKLTGDVLPIRQADIYSKIGGNLEDIYADMGDYIRKDQLLALIDTTEPAQQNEQAAATFENAQTEYERVKKLAAQNFASPQDLDNAEAAMRVAKANYDEAQTKLSYARITAPFSSFVTRRYLDPGALVNSNNSILFTLMDLDRMKILVNILEKNIPYVTQNTKASITVDAYPGKRFEGRVTRVSEALDLATRTMAVQIEIPNPEFLLKPGMFANVTLVLNEDRNAITVPTEAVLKDYKGYFVFILQDNLARRKDIQIGAEQDSLTEIVSGLAEADTIITVGQQFLKDGGPVNVQQ
jgi:membrane fusion protein (multidrug efflux system)